MKIEKCKLTKRTPAAAATAFLGAASGTWLLRTIFNFQFPSSIFVTVQSHMKVVAQTRACVARAELYLPVLSARSNGTGRNGSARATLACQGTERLPIFQFCLLFALEPTA